MNSSILKPYLFVFLYTLIGIISWQAYYAISTEDTSLPAIKNFMITNVPGGSYFAATTPTKINTGVSSNITQLEKYEKELEQLRNLPAEALPEGIIKPEEQEYHLLDNLPRWESGENKLNLDPKESPLIKRLRDPLSRE